MEEESGGGRGGRTEAEREWGEGEGRERREINEGRYEREGEREERREKDGR